MTRYPIAAAVFSLMLALTGCGGSDPGDPPTTGQAEDEHATLTGWVVLFNSADPSHWNANVGVTPDAPPYAVALDDGPTLIRYLRLTRTDTGASVILSMSEYRLQRNTAIGRYGWQGTNEFAWGGYHLGIYDITSASNARGFAAIAPTEPFVAQTSYRGWGFGNNNLVDDRQMFAWALNPIGQTPFEIAVTARDLTDEERGHLLE